MAIVPKQTSFISFEPTKRTRRVKFLDTMDKVVPWPELVAVVAPHYEPAKTGRPLTDCEVLIRCLCLAAWFGRGDEMLEEDIHEMPLYRKFLGLECGDARIPDHTVMCRFRNLLEAHGLARKMFTRINALLAARGLILKEGTAVDATIIDAPSGTKNENSERTPGCSSTKKGSNYRYGLKAHTGTDMDTGVVHSLVITPANEADVSQTEKLTHGEESLVVGDKGYVSAALTEFAAKLGALRRVPKGEKERDSRRKDGAPYGQLADLLGARHRRAPVPRREMDVGKRPRPITHLLQKRILADLRLHAREPSPGARQAAEGAASGGRVSTGLPVSCETPRNPLKNVVPRHPRTRNPAKKSTGFGLRAKTLISVISP